NSSHHASLSGKRFGPSPTFCTELNLPYGSPHGYRSSSQSSPSPPCAWPFSRDLARVLTRSTAFPSDCKIVQNSKCRCWCRLQRNAPFISLLSWTEVGLKRLG